MGYGYVKNGLSRNWAEKFSAERVLWLGPGLNPNRALLRAMGAGKLELELEMGAGAGVGSCNANWSCANRHTRKRNENLT